METQILRTSRDGCYELRQNAWGSFLAPAPDPEATVVITDEQLKGFELRDDIARIPADLWSRWLQLCFELTRLDDRNLEVSCRLLRNEEDTNKYRIVIPEQVVTTVSVRVDSFDKAIDIETGEVIEQWPPEGWRPIGSSHSHNTMEAFFSGTDDKYELGDPGLHVVVGCIDVDSNDYTLKASITANKRRFIIEPDQVIDLTPVNDVTYHPSVMTIIQLPEKRKASQLPTIRTTLSDYSLIETKGNADLTPVKEEMNEIHFAALRLIETCKLKGVSATEALSDLALTIDDLAIQQDEDRMFSDPFYWGTY